MESLPEKKVVAEEEARLFNEKDREKMKAAKAKEISFKGKTTVEEVGQKHKEERSKKATGTENEQLRETKRELKISKKKLTDLLKKKRKLNAEEEEDKIWLETIIPTYEKELEEDKGRIFPEEEAFTPSFTMLRDNVAKKREHYFLQRSLFEHGKTTKEELAEIKKAYEYARKGRVREFLENDEIMRAKEFLFSETEKRKEAELAEPAKGWKGKLEKFGGRFGSLLSKGIEKWDNWGNEKKKLGAREAGIKSFKLLVSMGMIGLGTVGGVVALSALGIGSTAALAGGVTSYLGNKLTLGLSVNILSGEIPKKHRQLFSTLTTVELVGATVFSGGELIAGAGLAGATLFGYGASNIFKRYDIKNQKRIEKLKEETNLYTENTYEPPIFDESYSKFLGEKEKKIEAVLKANRRSRIFGKIIEVSTALAGGIGFLEGAGIMQENPNFFKELKEKTINSADKIDLPQSSKLGYPGSGLHYANENPSSEIPEKTEIEMSKDTASKPSSDTNISWWQKIKGFFGSDKPQVEPSVVENTRETNPQPAEQSEEPSVSTQEKTKLFPTQDAQQTNTPSNTLEIEPYEIEQEGDGVTQIFARTLRADSDLASKLRIAAGFEGDRNNDQGMAVLTKKLAEMTGYIDPATGDEVRLAATGVGKVAYELRIDDLGNPVVMERDVATGKLLDIQSPNLEGKVNEYEYSWKKEAEPVEIKPP